MEDGGWGRWRLGRGGVLPTVIIINTGASKHARFLEYYILANSWDALWGFSHWPHFTDAENETRVGEEQGHGGGQSQSTGLQTPSCQQ